MTGMRLFITTVFIGLFWLWFGIITVFIKYGLDTIAIVCSTIMLPISIGAVQHGVKDWKRENKERTK